MAINTRKKIIIADDQETNRRILSQIMRDEYDVFLACDGSEVLSILDENSDISAILLDLVMPVMDGFQVLSKLQLSASHKHIPVIVITSCNDADSEIKALELGAVDIVLSPYNPQIVFRRLRNAIERTEALLAIKIQSEMLSVVEHDGLTGLYNRSAFIERTKGIISDKDANAYILSCLNIDGFKVINDRFGHDEGDRLLCYVADFLKEEVEKYGGITCREMADEYLILIPSEEDILDRFVNNLFGHIENYNLSTNINIHIGNYAIDDSEQDINLMIDHAMLAMKSIKGLADEHVAWFDEGMRKQIVRAQELTYQMRSALADNQFVVYFQPQFNFSEKKLSGAEALVRWKHPEEGLISPGEFIPLFEKNGFICSLDKFVWERACQYQREWMDKGLQVYPISVNISRRDISDPELPDFIEGLIKKYGLDTHMLHLEITESAYVDNPHQVIEVVTELQKRGFVVEMDDFGSGYSSLNTLKDVPVDVLKLDMKFNSKDNSARSGNILSSVIRMAHWLKLPVIAEGVETNQQAEYLNSIGCYVMQGFLFARPMPAEDYEKVLKQFGEEFEVEKVYWGADIKGALDFLDASTQATLLFNSFVGGALIAEFQGGNVESIRANNDFFRVIEISREEYKDYVLHLQDRLYPESKEKLIEALNKAIKIRGEVLLDVHCLPFREGKKDYYLSLKIRFLAQNIQKYIFYISLERSTERLELNRVKERFDNVISSIPGGVIIFDVNDKTVPTYFSNTACSLFGISRAEADGRINNRIPLEDNVVYYGEIVDLLKEFKGVDTLDNVITISKQNGERIKVRMHAVLKKNAVEGNIVYTTIIEIP